MLLLPDEGAALVVLTNSWRGSGLIRRVVAGLDLLPAPPAGSGWPARPANGTRPPI